MGNAVSLFMNLSAVPLLCSLWVSCLHFQSVELRRNMGLFHHTLCSWMTFWYMEEVEGYQQFPEISACKKCCHLQRRKVSWFSSGKQGTIREFPGLFRQEPWRGSSSALSTCGTGSIQDSQNPQNPERHSAVMMRLYDVCHWHSPVWKQKEFTAGAATVSQGYSSFSSVREGALSLYLSKAVCRFKNGKKEDNFW